MEPSILALLLCNSASPPLPVQIFTRCLGPIHHFQSWGSFLEHMKMDVMASGITLDYEPALELSQTHITQADHKYIRSVLGAP